MNHISEEAITVTRSVCLKDIKSKAEWVLSDAVDLRRYCDLIVTLPDYETEAEAAVAAAYFTLEEALVDVRRAYEKMRVKRINRTPSEPIE